MKDLIKVYKPYIMSTTCPGLGVEVVLTPLGLPSERSQVQFPQQRLCPANVPGRSDYHHSITVTQCEVQVLRPERRRSLTGHWPLTVTDGFYDKMLRTVTVQCGVFLDGKTVPMGSLPHGWSFSKLQIIQCLYSGSLTWSIIVCSMYC